MPPVSKPLTSEALSNDLGHTAELLRAIDRIIPGRVDEELLAFLDHTRANGLSLDLLVSKLNEGAAR